MINFDKLVKTRISGWLSKSSSARCKIFHDAINLKDARPIEDATSLEDWCTITDIF